MAVLKAFFNNLAQSILALVDGLGGDSSIVATISNFFNNIFKN